MHIVHWNYVVAECCAVCAVEETSYGAFSANYLGVFCAVLCCVCSRGNLLWGQTGWDHATTVSGDEGKAFVVSFLSTFKQFQISRRFYKDVSNYYVFKILAPYFNILLPIRTVSFSGSISQDITCLACFTFKRGPTYSLLSCLWFKHPSRFYKDFYQPKL